MKLHNNTHRACRLGALLMALWLPTGALQAQPVGPVIPVGPIGPVAPVLPLLPNAPPAATAIGTLAVLLPGGKAGSGIDIPDAKVWLLDGNNLRVATDVTQLNGHFRLKAPKAGVYQICWDIQGRSDCRREVALPERANFVGRIETRLHALLLHGDVLTGDGRPCWVNDPFFKLDVSTRVDLEQGNGGRPIASQRANVKGQYVLAVDNAGIYGLRAHCEKAQAKAEAQLRASVLRVDLPLGNRAPRIHEMAAFDGARNARRAAPNTPLELRVNALDRDNDTLEYLWRDNDNQAITANANGRIARQTAASPGRHSSYVVARDGKGGYAWRRVDVEVGKAEVRFSGTVLDDFSRTPVANAQVQMGGVTVATGANGWFALKAPAIADERYVLNIRHNNYALVSQVFDRSVTGTTYTLQRAQVRQVPRGVRVSITDAETGRLCANEPVGTATTAGNKREIRRTPPSEWVDPEAQERGRALPPELMRRLTQPRPCLRAGAQIIIPPGALVDARTGRRVNTAVRTAVATLDPTRRALPGDYQAVDGGGARTELLSYGAVYAEFRDAGGALLNLRPGATAEVRIPVPAQQQSTAKPLIDFWSYDEASGRWQIEGQAQLKQTLQGPFYVAKTKHFSTLNMDVAGNDPATATCVRFELGNTLAAWSGNIRMRATVSFNGNAVVTKETVLDGTQYHAVFRIPFGNSFPPNTLRVELFTTINNQSVVLVDNIINTDARTKMTGNDLWPPHPHTPCGTPVVLDLNPIALPEYASNDATGRPYFLTGPGGAWLPIDGETLATNYYAAIGATANKPTLDAWWTTNGFAADGTGGTRASYLNHNDLGFGRDMHCRNNGSNLACYVTNYGAADQNPDNANFALDQEPGKRGATVAMEFDATAGAKGVQFFVYGNSNTAGLLKFADLDGFGPKPVPHLCLVCHGGGPDLAADSKAEHARFREFDLPSFKYSSNRSWDFGQATLNAAELQAYGTLNQMVRNAAPVNTPIRNLISAWYPGSFNAAPIQPTPPAGWNANAADRQGYHAVYGPTCRTCHLARDGGGVLGDVTFSSKASFAGTSFYVCGKDYRIMPNAVITYKNFWADPARVLGFEGLTGVTANTCKND